MGIYYCLRCVVSLIRRIRRDCSRVLKKKAGKMLHGMPAVSPSGKKTLATVEAAQQLVEECIQGRTRVRVLKPVPTSS